MSEDAREAIIIPLEVWPDAQGDRILIYSEGECCVYFNCWMSGVPADFIAQLSFERASGVRSFRRESLPYRFPPHKGGNYILRIPESDLVRDHVAYREKRYAHSNFKQPIPEHYVVVGHYIYHEILATGFKTTQIPKHSVTDPRLLRLIAAE